MWQTLTDFFSGVVSGATGGASGSLAEAGAIWTSLTNYRMWRSLGWLLLGIVLTILGFVIWNRRAIGGAVKTAAAA